MYKLLSLMLMLTCTVLTSIAQETIPAATINLGRTEPNTDWQEYISTDDVTIEYRFENCDPEMGYDQEQVMLKVTNHTANKVQLDWHMILYYNGECKTCDFPEEYGYQLVLAPNETVQGDCSVYSELFQLRLFSRFIDVKYTSNDLLTGFRMDNLTLTGYTE